MRHLVPGFIPHVWPGEEAAKKVIIPVIIPCSQHSQYAKLRLRAHGVVSDRFHSELFQKAPDLFTYFNENQHKPRLRTKTKNFMRSEFL